MKKRIIDGGVFILLLAALMVHQDDIKNHITTEINNRNKIDSLQLEVDKRNRMIQTFSENHDVDVVGVAIEADNYIK